jgi:glycerol-3-phosphate acyltransferase PlsY
MAIFIVLLCLVTAYLLGSVCSAVIICRVFSLPDPRTVGSMNPGATNVLRIAGKHYAIMVLVADMLKGLLPVLLAQALSGNPVLLGYTCLAAVLGHMFPIFFQFRGGKGVATTLGGILGINLILGSMVIATWLLVVNFSRHVSLASLVAIVFSPFFSLFIFHGEQAFIPLLIVAFLVFYKHRDNINRLIDGTEPKLTSNKLADTSIAVEKTDSPAGKKPHQTKVSTAKKNTTSTPKKPVSKAAKKPATKAAPKKKPKASEPAR